jgi:protein-L-isoaspartate(D-aspartate) O-methyltransferase
MTLMSNVSDRATVLRNQVVDQLVAGGTIITSRVEEVMRAVPREQFAPEFELEKVYEPFNGLVTKKDDAGNSLSSLSAPQVQAHMLELARIEPGMNVLEIGSGGMNAAYLAEMVGPDGAVTTVDIDEFVTDRATRFLGQAGFGRVNVVTADAEHGVSEHAPYDRILVTVGAWDVPPAWVDQLTDDGRLVLPLSVFGLTRTIALVKDGDHLVSDSSRLFGFVPMQGAGAHASTRLALRDGVVTLVFDEQSPADPAALERAMASTTSTVVEAGGGLALGEPWGNFQMWLATSLPGFCRIVIDDSASAAPPPGKIVGLGAVDGASVAYLAIREWGKDVDLALDVHAYGPSAAELAESVAEQLRVWNAVYRTGPGPQYLIYPAGTRDADLPEAQRIVDKPHSRVLLSWPGTHTTLPGQADPHHPNHR